MSLLLTHGRMTSLFLSLQVEKYRAVVIKRKKNATDSMNDYHNSAGGVFSLLDQGLAGQHDYFSFHDIQCMSRSFSFQLVESCLRPVHYAMRWLDLELRLTSTSQQHKEIRRHMTTNIYNCCLRVPGLTTYGPNGCTTLHFQPILWCPSAVALVTFLESIATKSSGRHFVFQPI